MTARTHPEVSQSVCASPNGDFESGALPKTSRGDGCRGGRCSPVGVDPATQGELFTLEPRCPRKAAEPGSEARHDANRGPKLGSMPPRPTGKAPARVTESPQRFRTLARERGGGLTSFLGRRVGKNLARERRKWSMIVFREEAHFSFVRQWKRGSTAQCCTSGTRYRSGVATARAGNINSGTPDLSSAGEHAIFPNSEVPVSGLCLGGQTIQV